MVAGVRVIAYQEVDSNGKSEQKYRPAKGSDKLIVFVK